MNKRAYYFGDGDYGYAIIACSVKEARKLLWQNSDVRDCCEDLWINLDPKWIKGAKVDDLPIGHTVEAVDGVKRDVYSYAYEAQCPICGKEETTVEKWNDSVGCFDCLEQME